MAKVNIIHTADWHIGKQLHKYSLEEDIHLFLDWLERLIREKEIDLLLVSGDIFDTSFPSNASLSLYYGFLTKLIGSNCRVVITGGNHDSPGLLNAPREILKFLDIKVIGCAPEIPGENLLLFEDLGIAVAAVPFLRESDLRRSVAGQSYGDRMDTIREGIKMHYQELVDRHDPDSGLSLIGMGHLYVHGATTSESERDIHSIGGLAAFGTEHFPGGFEYMALGHIHKPQILASNIRYSGSPVPLSFSERHDQKYVVQVCLEEGRLSNIEPIAVPLSRELRRISGNLEEVEAELSAYQPATVLEPLIELDVTEPFFDPQKSLRFEQLLRQYDEAPFRIIKPRLTFENRQKEAVELFATGTQIEDLSPAEVFRKKLDEELLEADVKLMLLEAFDELMAEI